MKTFCTLVLYFASLVATCLSDLTYHIELDQKNSTVTNTIEILKSIP